MTKMNDLLLPDAEICAIINAYILQRQAIHMTDHSIMNDPQFQKEQAKAAAIGKYAVYRYTYLAVSQQGEYKSLKLRNMLWTHLDIIQYTVTEYVKHFTQCIMNSEEYRNLEKKTPERAVRTLLKAVETEEERIGNKWICVKNPFESKTFCHWSEKTAIARYRVRETERLRKNADKIKIIFGFNKYGEFSQAEISQGDLTFPLESLYKLVYRDIMTLEEERLSADERVELLHKRREVEDIIYSFMQMRERIEKAYKNTKK